MFLYYLPSSKSFTDTKHIWGMGRRIWKRWSKATIVCETQAKTYSSPSLFPAEELVAWAGRPIALTLHFSLFLMCRCNLTELSWPSCWDSMGLVYMEDHWATECLMGFLGSWLSQDHSVVVYLLPRKFQTQTKKPIRFSPCLFSHLSKMPNSVSYIF